MSASHAADSRYTPHDLVGSDFDSHGEWTNHLTRCRKVARTNAMHDRAAKVPKAITPHGAEVARNRTAAASHNAVVEADRVRALAALRSGRNVRGTSPQI